MTRPPIEEIEARLARAQSGEQIPFDEVEAFKQARTQDLAACIAYIRELEARLYPKCTCAKCGGFDIESLYPADEEEAKP